jgi:transposase
MSEPVRRLELFTGAGRRRTWSEDEKAAIIAESEAPNTSISAVARRHGLSASQLFTWRRHARGSGAGSPAMFVPAVLSPSQDPAPAERWPGAHGPGPLSGIEVEVAGARVWIGPDAGPKAITAVIRALKASS